MSNYTKNTNFTAKDNLTSGDPAKVIKGAEFDTEFNALETAVNSKADSNNSQLTGTTNAQIIETTGNVTVGGNLSVAGNATISGNLTFGNADTDTVSFSADVNSNIIPDADATYDLGSPTKEWRNIYVDGTAFLDTINFNGTNISATAAELNTLDGITATTAELNILDGVTSTTAEINKLDGFTGTVADLNYAKDLRATGVTTAEFDKLDGLTATTSELNVLDGITATTTELNYTDGVTSNIQTQLNSKVNNTQSPTLTLTGDVSGSATFTNLGNASLSVTIADDSHNHTISNVDGLQTALDAKASLSGATFTGDVTVGGELTTDHATLTAIAQTKAENAVDVFVYDTSKDSDGGAWRHRTQHTSWYNETLNTATRGSRKEFPAVAVIVAETNKVTIYDGDDPSLPMWMVFEGGLDSKMLGNTQTAVVLKNGALWVALNGYGVSEINFIKDEAWRHRNNTSSAYYGRFNNDITGRNLSGTFSKSDYTGALVNDLCNDVAMTVLPDAPIDPATGLPIPTIAVATDGGVSVIKDDGTVVDWYGSVWFVADQLGFNKDNSIWAVFGTNTNKAFQRKVYVFDIPTTDVTNEAGKLYEITGYTAPYIMPELSTDQYKVLNMATGQYTVHSNAKDLTAIINVSGADIANSLYAYTTSSYNTGWMNGDIKLATLSDTDDTDLVGSELVTNGTFDTDISGWTETDVNNHVTPSHNAGALRITSTANTTGAVWMGQTITGLTAGQLYTVSADVTITGSANVSVILHNPYITSFPEINSSGVYSFTFKASSTTHEIRTYIAAGFTTGSTVDFDNVSLRVAEPDRSVNNNGLQVFGTVQKNPVATGADLVGYSGFSSSNYLEQPYNPDLDFGTGDFCIMGWVKDSSGSGRYIVDFSTESGTDRSYFIVNRDQKTVYVPFGDLSGLPLSINVWQLIGLKRENGSLFVIVDGKQYLLNSNYNVNFGCISTSVKTHVNSRYTKSESHANIALYRMSATAPTAEQIKKIYEDEKVLFQENAKATLHGTSDAVTALAYDDTTELLHVGTSAGRSVFQGLRRVDNTTDAVGVAISASNGLVAEE